MNKEYLALGFRNVDTKKDKEAYYHCLHLLDSLPYYQQTKKKSYELLDLHDGVTLLEAGCGLGHDVFRMALLVLPDGHITGLDSSKAMIAAAQANPLAAVLPVGFVQGDIRELPFCDQSFSRCRVDRTLQHVFEPEAAIAELIRVLKPGGLLLAYDNDWETFSIRSRCNETNRTLESLWIHSFASPAIGRHLHKSFAAAGIDHPDVYPGTSIIDDFSTADNIYNLTQTMEKAVSKGIITPEAAISWMNDLLDLQAQGAFFVKLDAFTVLGRKPF